MSITPAAAARPQGYRNDPTRPINKPGPMDDVPPAEVARHRQRAVATVARVERYWRERLGRDGYDGHGAHAHVKVDVNEVGAEAEPLDGTLTLGRWSTHEWFSDSPAIVGHEFTHLVIQNLADVHDPAHAGQLEGARAQSLQGEEFATIHEGLADTMGAAFVGHWGIKGRDPSTGDGVESDFRSFLANSDRVVAIDREPREPHYAGGIVSTAMVRIQRELGWDAMAHIAYGGLQDPRFDTRATFQRYARYAIDAAAKQYGAHAAAVTQAAFAANHVRPTAG